MNIRTHTIALLLGALTLGLTPAIAGARTIYFLVGVRHVYRIGPDRDLYIQQREEIEKTYADGVASDEATYQQHISDGADDATEAKARDQDLELLAEDRDKSLGALFDVRDDLKERYPQFQIQGDGPYQVIGVDYHVQEDVMVFDSFCVFAPWPGYVVVGRPYGGWVYGEVYTPSVFLNLYVGWRGSFGIGVGVPLFWGGFVGHAGPVPFHAGVFAGPPAVWIHPGGYYHAVGVRQGFIGASGFVHGGFNRTAPAPGGNHGWGYSHGTGASAGHSGAPAVTHESTGGYTHSWGSRSDGTPASSHGWGDRSTSGSHSFDRTSSSGSGSSSSRRSGGYTHGGSHSSSHSSHSDHGSSGHDSHDHH